MKVAVLGNGGFGTAMALVAERAGNQVRLWGHDAEYTAELARTRENPRYLPGVRVPEAVRVSGDPAAVLASADVVLVGVPTQHMRAAVGGMVAELGAGVPLVSLAKGLEQSTRARPSQVLAELTEGRNQVLVLSGPSHAEEVARGLPTTVVLAGDLELAERLQPALSDARFRVYRNDDLLGVELSGALKNVMALAAGIAEGFGLGDNAKAGILSRGLVEMQRYGVAEGARLDTFYGLAGVGDLAVTAFSAHGRNRAFGERIGRGETLDEILASTRKVAEGVWTSRAVRERARELGVEMPLCETVCAILFEGVSPGEAVKMLMEREHKAE